MAMSSPATHSSQGSALGRAWDAFDAYLFDIDRTLINCTDATHYFAFHNAVEKVFGVS